jgi:hypothetical protein
MAEQLPIYRAGDLRIFDVPSGVACLSIGLGVSRPGGIKAQALYVPEVQELAEKLDEWLLQRGYARGEAA